MKWSIQVKARRNGIWEWDILLVIWKEKESCTHIAKAVLFAHEFKEDTTFFYKRIFTFPKGKLPPREEVIERAENLIETILKEIEELRNELKEKGYYQEV